MVCGLVGCQGMSQTEKVGAAVGGVAGAIGGGFIGHGLGRAAGVAGGALVGSALGTLTAGALIDPKPYELPDPNPPYTWQKQKNPVGWFDEHGLPYEEKFGY